MLHYWLVGLPHLLTSITNTDDVPTDVVTTAWDILGLEGGRMHCAHQTVLLPDTKLVAEPATHGLPCVDGILKASSKFDNCSEYC